MNLFNLDEDLDKSAEFHVDKHVNKMILEAAQICCTVIWVDRLLGFVPRALEKHEAAVLNEYKKLEKPLKPEERKLTPYLGMMYNHPSTIWARSSLENYEWTWCYAHALAEEYRYRYGKEHKSFWQVVNKLPEPGHLESVGLTPFAMAMPDILKNDEDPIQSYRNYYMLDKATFASWTGRPKPYWWDEDLADYEERITRK